MLALRGMRAQLGRLYRTGRQSIDRLLHARRHRDVIAARLLAPPSRILVLCHGNVCRSPYFAAALRRDLAQAKRTSVEVDSAGFVGPGRAVPDESLLASAGRNVSLDHCSKLVTADMIASSDLVIVMDSVQATRVRRDFGASAGKVIIAGDLDPLPIETRVIRDPWKQSVDVFTEVFDRIDRCARVLVDAIVKSER